MSRPYSLALCVLSGLALAASPATTASPPQPLRQVTIPPSADHFWPNPDIPVKPDAPKPIFLYSFPLRHISQKLLFSEMDQAFVPNAETVVLKPGETLHYPFRIQGLKAVIPGPTDHMLTVLATATGFSGFRDLYSYFDVPRSGSMQPLPGQRGGKSGTKRSAAPPPTSSHRTLCQSAPGIPAAPEVGGPEVTESIIAQRFYLTHTTPLTVLGELRRAYVPDGGAVVLKPGETLRSSFALKGVVIMFPNVQDNSLLVYATYDALDFVKNLFKTLDVSDRPERWISRPTAPEPMVTVGP